MLIAIDESGPFSSRSTGKPVDCVGALIVPDRDAPILLTEFAGLALPRSASGEVKGRGLAPTDFDAVTGLLERFPDVLVFVEGIDMSVATAVRVARFQRDQAASIGRNAPDDATEFVKTKILRLRQEVAALSAPLFIELILLTELVDSVVRWASIYYALRVPSELGRFAWRIDPKEISQRTQYEKLWMEMVSEFLQMRSLRQPLAIADAGDYSSMERFRSAVTELPGYLRPYSASPDEPLAAFDVRRLLGEDRGFPDSEIDIGVQFADVVVNGLRRGFNDQLPWDVASRLARRVIRKPRGTLPVSVLTMDAARQLENARPSWWALAHEVAGHGRTLV